ncbi:polysaccharide deacetylase family protein [Pseudoalteromonas sp. SG43-7]|uniref:polysaccharide deacetylase family protein n=1 Tax=unclassified Pseudoalteromonas TaxID=194690 RepID=UPI0016027BC1|nr:MULTISPECIES: polysaccharide deacetylase family protein [unclassified Pseudoalteromonas]MBB1409681.1 polysaccharide deacetylase family protein [Pseudoalteromonas sp. SG44-17]MBB1420692.1 polysaccharide deacetylase family protein [Pseudoalteromonas sp. SG43-7]
MLKISSLIMTISVLSFSVIANPESQKYLGFNYPHKAQNAVSITFDDARHSQVDVGAAILNRYQVKATFYVSPFNVKQRLTQWQDAVKSGHEIANHTSSHVCTGNFEWLRAQDLSLEHITLKWLENDILSAQQYLKDHLGVTPRAFAYPCGNTFVGRGIDTKSYVPLIAKHFDSGRTWLDESANNPNFTDFAQLTGLRIDGMSFDEIITMLDQLRENNAWLILAGHEIGNGDQYTTDAKVLEQLLVYLKDPANGYWLDTVSNVSDYVRQQRKPLN